MASVRYVGPIDEVDLPLIRRSLTRGEVFEVDDDTAAALCLQIGNYEPAGDAPSKAEKPGEGDR